MLQSRSVKRATLVDYLKKALKADENHFFADTSFLIAAASLSPTARGELSRWLRSLGLRFHVPAWVAHEIFGKITSGVDLFAPMSKIADQAIAAIEALQLEARRYVDDGRSNALPGRPDRIGYLAELDRISRSLIEQAKAMRRAKQTVEEAADWVVDVVNGALLSSNIYGGLPYLDADYSVRVIGGQPPGFMDKGKAERTRHGDNRYGDLIIWREIVDYVGSSNVAGVVLLTNDNKLDWVYVPPTILDEGGRPLNNEARGGFKIILPLPLLVHELATARPGAELTIANLGMLSQLLHDVNGDAPNLFSAYQPIASVVPLRTAPDRADAEPQAVMNDEDAVPFVEVPADNGADLRRLFGTLSGPDIEAASLAAAAARDIIARGIDPALAPRLAQDLLTAADNGVEAAEILVREIVTEQLRLDKDIRLTILRAMLEALYYDDQAKLRNRPLEAPLADVFTAQSIPELKDAVDALTARLGPSRRYFLVTPDPAVFTLTISLSTDHDKDGRLRLRGIYAEETPLLEDVARDSERSLSRLLGGKDQADGATLRRVLSRYFRIPEAQLDLGLSSFETVHWDGLTGLIDWGVNTGLQLR
jgi:hypothetical protein